MSLSPGNSRNLYFPDFDGTKDSKMYDTEYLQSEPWKDSHYYALPENVRNAIDISNIKSKHSQFYYRLQNLNDKIFVFNSLFYQNLPNFERVFMKKK